MTTPVEVSSVATDETHHYVRLVRLSSAPVQDVPEKHWSHKGKQFVPIMLSARWNHGEVPSEVRVTGLLLKKDGSVGTAEVTIRYGLEAGGWQRLAPQWISDLILAPQQPTDDASR